MEFLDKMMLEKGEYFIAVIFGIYFAQYLWIGF